MPSEPVLGEDGQPMVLEVPYPGRVVYSHIWRVNVGRMKLYLLDTDLDQNSEWDRQITHKLYGGDWENRIKQEYLLGIADRRWKETARSSRIYKGIRQQSCRCVNRTPV